MPDGPAQKVVTLREDIVLSICFFDLAPTQQALKYVRSLSDKLSSFYRFQEIILVIEAKDRDAALLFVEEIEELRLFVVRSDIGFYERRVVAAEEAIGDIVLIASSDEIPSVDVQTFIERSEATNSIVLGTLGRKSMRLGLSSAIIALGHTAGFKVSLNDLQTMAIPRTLLNQLLRHPEPQLALRFPPRDPGLPLAFIETEHRPTANGYRKLNDLPRRLQLLQKLLVHLAPTLLMLVALTSTILSVLGIGYAVYTVGAWILVETLAPGWLTTSAMLSLSATFMGLSMLGLSLGVQQLLNQQRQSNDPPVSEEVNRVDLFGKVASDLNIEVETEAGRGEHR